MVTAIADVEVEGFKQNVVLAIRNEAPTSPRASALKILETAGDRLFNELTPHDRERFSLRAPLETRALALAREGKLDAAYAVAEEIAGLDGQERLSSPARLLADCTRESVLAYVSFCRGEFDGAELALCNAISAIGTLMSKHSLAPFAGRQVFLGTHWVRIKLKRNDVDAAIQASMGLLAYAEGDLFSWPVASCSPGPYACDPRDEFVAGRVTELFEQVSLAFSCGASEVGGAVLSSMAPHCAGSCVHFTRTHDWIRLKAFALQGNANQLIPEAMRFLATNRRDSPMCWDVVAADLLRTCLEHPTSMTASIASALEPAIVELRLTSPILATASQRGE